MGGVEDGDAWVAQLPPGLAAQKALLHGLLSWCRADSRARWLTVGCSLARGNADWMSDLDLGLGVEEGQVRTVAADLKLALAGIGPLVACFDHALPGLEWPHRRLLAQYADRSQVDLVVMPADRGQFREPGVVLYDLDGVVELLEPYVVTPEHVGRWAGLAWAALADLGKYLRRGSLWEALARAQEARDHYWCLLAVAEGVPLPQYGVTSLLDALPPTALPARSALTATELTNSGILAAARALASLLDQVQARVELEDAASISALAEFVSADLSSLVVL